MTKDHLPKTGRLANIVTTGELLSAGLSAAQIRTRVLSGDLMRLNRGVYAPAGLARSVGKTDSGALALRAAAALASLGPGSAASHDTAARLLGLDLLGKAAPEMAITRSPGSGSRKSWPGVRVHNAALSAEHLGQRGGVPVTTASRTVVDLARASAFRAGVVTADSALRRKLTTKAELHAVVADCRGWPGVHRAAEVVAFADALSESPLESIARVAFCDCGLPPPELQALLAADGRIIARVDFYWKRFRTVAEADGELKYDNRFEATYQLRRDADLREAAFEVVHFGWTDVFVTPMQVAASIRAAFARGSQLVTERGPAA
jgi:Transcriptional regulator, AbiEi antitoxin